MYDNKWAVNISFDYTYKVSVRENYGTSTSYKKSTWELSERLSFEKKIYSNTWNLTEFSDHRRFYTDWGLYFSYVNTAVNLTSEFIFLQVAHLSLCTLCGIW